MNKLSTDVAIIGAGTAGMAAYKAVIKSGRSAILVEGGPYGTTCACVGCMPSKLLIAAADAAHAVRSASAFGIDAEPPRIDGVRVMARVRSERDRFVGFVLDSIDNIPAPDKVRGWARFLSDNTLQVDDHTQVQVGRGIVVATGSSPMLPAMYQSLGQRLIVNDDVFQWNDLPKRVLVVGAGVIGLEIGQALARLGVQVCIVNRSAGIGGISDPSVRASAHSAFAAELDLRLDTNIVAVDLQGDAVCAQLQTKDGKQSHITVDYVLVATGRKPNIAHLGLDNTSVPLDDKGMPRIDPFTLQLGSAAIFIAGDVTGSLPVLHEANEEGHFAGYNAAHYPDIHQVERKAPLSMVFTDPQLAQAGSRFRHLPDTGVVIGQASFVNQGRARILLKNYGMLRVYVRVEDGLFLGAEMAGPAMEHIAHLLAWSVQQGLSVYDMLAMPFYHPVLEEGLRTALRHAAAQLATAKT